MYNANHACSKWLLSANTLVLLGLTTWPHYCHSRLVCQQIHGPYRSQHLLPGLAVCCGTPIAVGQPCLLCRGCHALRCSDSSYWWIAVTEVGVRVLSGRLIGFTVRDAFGHWYLNAPACGGCLVRTPVRAFQMESLWFWLWQ